MWGVPCSPPLPLIPNLDPPFLLSWIWILYLYNKRKVFSNYPSTQYHLYKMRRKRIMTTNIAISRSMKYPFTCKLILFLTVFTIITNILEAQITWLIFFIRTYTFVIRLTNQKKCRYPNECCRNFIHLVMCSSKHPYLTERIRNGAHLSHYVYRKKCCLFLISLLKIIRCYHMMYH